MGARARRQVDWRDYFELESWYSMKQIIAIIFVLALTPMARAVTGDLIDFETGFERKDEVTSITTASNTISFSTEGLFPGTTFIAEVGTMPKDAFERVIDFVIHGDTPFGGNPGRYFLTDGAGNQNDIVFDFELPVSSFSLDLYDFVGDGGAFIGDSISLRAFSDAARTSEVASAVYTVPFPQPADGSTETLSVAADSIKSVLLDFDVFDRGTGFDNISFVTVPEPSAFALALMGLLSLYRRRRSR